MMISSKRIIAAVAANVLIASFASAQPSQSASAESSSVNERIDHLSREVDELKTLVHQLQSQLAAQAASVAQATLAARATPAPGVTSASTPPPAPAAAASLGASNGLDPAAGNGAAVGGAPAVASTAAPPAAGNASPASRGVVGDLLHGVTIDALLDGYYEYNTNDPIGRVNYLRAFDVSSNSFSLNQADLILESAPDPAGGKREGVRIDLQYGQATSSLQGNPANELRPEVYRDIFQAYGTYVFPLGAGLTVDFGKWASSLGIEGNYTKDQLNYSRSFWFDYLPFYHMGVRAKYAVNDQLAFNLWITNGTDQTEAFNNYKDQMVGFVLTPSADLSWTVNFYNGQEHPDVIYLQAPGPGQKNLPNEQGTYILPIANPPTGRLDILDSYVSWQATKALILAAEADYVQERLYSYSSPDHVTGGALYGGYQLTPAMALALRLEYLADVGGLYTGTTQYLREGTFTVDYRLASDFLMRAEFRRDQSNQHYFLSNALGVLESSQQTIGLGLVWWFGQKQGAW
jgi:Putative beta-barrel porin-2, OmpL-like. bbp2